MRSPSKLSALSTIRQRGVPIKTILDVGVLDGTPELIQAFPDLTHVLFEPVREFNDRIHERYAGVSHVLANVAVSNTTGSTALAVTSAIAGVDITHSSMIESGVAGPWTEREVPMTTLDDFLTDADFAEPYLLKIDIDGHELRVLEGAARSLQHCSVVMIETPVHELTKRVSVLERAGFFLFDFVEPCYYDDALWQYDTLMIRADLRETYFSDINKDFSINKYHVWKG